MSHERKGKKAKNLPASDISKILPFQKSRELQ